MIKKIISISFATFFIVSLILILLCNSAFASPGYIYVYNPTGGTYYESDTISITWTSSDEYVKIELYRGGSYYNTIVSNTTNDGSYYYTIPSGYSSSYYYFIRIYNLADETEYDDSGYFYINSKSISISAPSGGETWYKGDSHYITWNSQNAGNYVSIQYQLGSSTYTIISSTNNDGSYLWTIPQSLTSSSSYRLKISSTTYSNIYDYSNYFSINERSITLTSPTGGEIWYKGETYAITWTSEDAGSYVKIQYSKGYSSYSYNIASRTNNDGYYEWTIPTSFTLSSQYRIKISSYSYSNVYDTSSYFSIDQRYIEIESPSRYSKWYPNETYTITWDSENAGDYVNIRLYKNDVYCATIATDQTNSGSYSWEIPNVFSADTNYKIEIRSTKYSGVYDQSYDFSIGGRSITLTSPANGDIYYIGESYLISWESENAGDYVDIELYKEGILYNTIETDVANTGRYNWEILSNPIPSSSYRIKITSSEFRDIFSYSEGEFTINQTVIQQITMPLLIIIFVIVGLAVAYVVFLKLKKDNAKAKKDANKQKIQPHEALANVKITPEEYNSIWEGNKP